MLKQWISLQPCQNPYWHSKPCPVRQLHTHHHEHDHGQAHDHHQGHGRGEHGFNAESLRNNDLLYRDVYRAVLDWLDAPPGASAMEAGCGAGGFTEILADASRTGRTWLQDFADDEVQISPDLYEILCSYRHLRPSA